MFRAPFTGSLILEPMLESEFKNISGDGALDGDNFALAVARLLLKPRIPADTNVLVAARQWRDREWRNDSSSEFLTDIISDSCESISFLLCLKEDKAAASENVLVLLNDEWERDASKGLELLNKNLTCDVEVFRNNKRRQAIILIANSDTREFHILCLLLNLYAPWYFKEQGIQPEEQKFLKVCHAGVMSDIEEMIDDIVRDMVDVETAKKRFYLDGYEQKQRANRITILRDKVMATKAQINVHYATIRSLYDSYRNDSFMLSALENYTDGSSNELADYFIENKHLSLGYCDKCSGEFEYITTGYLSIFDPDSIEESLENPRSLVYTSVDFYYFGITKDQFRRLLAAIFLDNQIKVRMCSAWTFRDGMVSPIKKYEYDKRFRTFLPNPHLHHFGCMGSWQEELENASMKMDSVRLIEISCAEATNLNWDDSVVVRAFLQDLLSGAVLELPDGEIVNYCDAIEWLEED